MRFYALGFGRLDAAEAAGFETPSSLYLGRTQPLAPGHGDEA